MTPKQFVAAFKKHGSVKAVARNTDLTYHATRQLYLEALREGLMEKQQVGRKSRGQSKEPERRFEGQVRARATRTLVVPREGIRRHLFTCAQNDTPIFEPFWNNLQVLAAHYGADIHVARLTYVKSGLGARGDKATVTKREDLYGGKDLTWDPRLEPYFSDDRLEIAPGLVWCGEMNILPTAVRPLSSLENYTGRKSAIFPHVKLAMESIASNAEDATKFNYTTGTVTLRNYIQRKAGLKAEFHHCYGALLVEVDANGDWFCRQINANSEGEIYDLDVRVDDGKLTTDNRVEAINWGDIHVDEMSPMVSELAWGEGGMLDTLRPKFQFMHDVVTFMGPSHHNIKKPFMMFLRSVQGFMDVKAEFTRAAAMLDTAMRSWCRMVSVDSNHHHHIARWLQEQDGRRDTKNIEFWLEMQRRVYKAIREDKREPNFLSEALYAAAENPKALRSVHFLDGGESYVICADANGGIECGSHGDLGPGGSRGNTRVYTTLGRKMNKGHDHKATIMDGVYSAGTCSNLNPDWAAGPNAWSHSHIVTYPNGKRAIITMWNDKWRA
jgi:hypothetical protein